VKSLVLLSGGVDSTTALALALEEGPCEAISIRYGQKHATEVMAGHHVANFYKVRQTQMTLVVPMGESVLMDPTKEMPHQTYEELSEAKGPSPTYVPFRNANMISCAVAHALAWGLDAVWVGVHAEDAHNWAYPDCTPEFIGAMQCAVYVGTYHKVRLIAPFQYATKGEIVRQGLELNVPYELTMSCYEGTVPACGECPTCIGRLHAFAVNHVKDPIPYREAIRG
jgi:7-cyano-7-deazaguanine synthase